MRFVFDELYNFSDDEDQGCHTISTSASSSPEPNLNEFSFVNPNEDDEGIPQLYLPKRKIVSDVLPEQRRENTDFEKLDPELEQLMSTLNLEAKLPSGDDMPLVILDFKRSIEFECVAPPAPLNEEDGDSNIDTKRLLSAMETSYIAKLNTLEVENRRQVETIKKLKKQAEDERRRKEEEARRRKEEEERCKQEAEAAKIRELNEQRKKHEEAQKLKKKQEEDALKQKKAEEVAAKERRKAEEEQNLKQQTLRSKTVTDFGSIEKLFWGYKEKVAFIKKDIVEPVKKADQELKTLLSRHKRKVNPKFGQLTNSYTQLAGIQQELSNLVDQTKNNHLAYLWILNFIAKAMVHQAETEVRVKPASALPLGNLALSLLLKYPELLDLLMARFVKKCPFVIGFACNIDTESGRLNMGWKRKSDDKWEDDVSYDERMGGIMTLYAVITRLPLPRELINTKTHPLPISHSWRFLARTANTPINLLTNTHFIVLGSWWDAAAVELLQAYGNQSEKLLRLVGDDLTASVADCKYVGAARLRILLEEWQTMGMQPFPGMTA